MKRCEYCEAPRSRLHKCVTCGARKCGCCSYKMRDGRRVCTLPLKPVSCLTTALKDVRGDLVAAGRD